MGPLRAIICLQFVRDFCIAFSSVETLRLDAPLRVKRPGQTAQLLPIEAMNSAAAGALAFQALILSSQVFLLKMALANVGSWLNLTMQGAAALLSCVMEYMSNGHRNGQRAYCSGRTCNSSSALLATVDVAFAFAFRSSPPSDLAQRWCKWAGQRCLMKLDWSFRWHGCARPSTCS